MYELVCIVCLMVCWSWLVVCCVGWVGWWVRQGDRFRPTAASNACHWPVAGSSSEKGSCLQFLFFSFFTLFYAIRQRTLPIGCHLDKLD